MIRRIVKVSGVGSLIGTFVGLCYALHTHVLGDEGHAVAWSWALAEYMSFWVGWGLLSGPIAVLVQRFPITRERRRNALYYLAASAVGSLLHSSFCYLVVHTLLETGALPKPHWPVSTMGAYILICYPRGMVYSLLIVAILHALIYYFQYEEKARAASQLEAQLAQAKLHLLKMQLHPHFLFNTLNSISALLHEDVEMADLMIERLGDFLRLTLDHSTAQEVSLREELEFLDCYLAIEQIRLQDRLTRTIDVEPQALEARVPALILQPIVENAIRHAIAPRAAGGKLEIAARRERSRLLMTVRDNGGGLASRSDGNGKGMGLAITRARLERLYPEDYRFELKNAPEGGLIVTLEFPFAPSIRLQVPA